MVVSGQGNTYLPWTYYLLGPNNKQLAVWNGFAGAACGSTANTVRLWPVEYNVYSGGERTIIRPNGTRELVMSNHLGSTACIFPLTGVNRTPIAQQITDAYGIPLTLQGAADPQRSRTSFIGRDVDRESNLGAFGVRLYSSEYGRFVAVDKLREEYSDNAPYHYSNNRPTLGLDPTGLGIDEVNKAGRKAQPHVIALWNEAVNILKTTGVAHELVGTLVAEGEGSNLINKSGGPGSKSIVIITTIGTMGDPLIPGLIGHVDTHNNPAVEGSTDPVEGVPPGFQDLKSTIETALVYGSASAGMVNFVAAGSTTFAYEISDPNKANTIDPDKLEEVQDRFDEAAENKDVNGFIEACVLFNALDCGVVIYKTKSSEVNYVPLSK